MENKTEHINTTKEWSL